MSVSNTVSDMTESQELSECTGYSESIDGSECVLGKRAKALKYATNKTVEKCCHAVKLAKFKKYYAEIDKHYPGVIDDLHAQLVAQLTERTKKETETLCQDLNFTQVLNSLDGIILENENTVVQSSWRPSGIPENDVRDHLYQVKANHKTAYENYLQKVLNKNEKSLAEVEENHIKILKLLEKNKDHVEKLKNVTGLYRSEVLNLTSERINYNLMKNLHLET